MLLKIVLISIVLLKAANARYQTEDSQRKVSFSVEGIWQRFAKKDDCSSCTCDDDEEWKAGVQAYYTGCRKATWNFRGPSYDLADTSMFTLQSYLTKLMYFANTNSTYLAPHSKAVLETMGKMKNLRESSLVIIYEWDKVISTVIREKRAVVLKLSKQLGKLALKFHNGLSGLYYVFSYFMKCFLRCKTVQCKQKVDYVPVVNQYQYLMNIVALVAETLIDKCNEEIVSSYEAMTVLSSIFQFVSIAVQGINSCVQDVLYQQNGVIPESMWSLSESMHSVLLQITPGINKVVYPFDKGIRKLLTLLVNITLEFNTSVKRSPLGVFQGVLITVGEISHF